MSWLFLAVSLVGAWFTVNAFRPTRRWQLLGASFFAGWLTTELALWHVAWQAAATAVFVWLGALGSWPGVLALAITLASWAGLLRVAVVSRRAAHIVEQALLDGLGADYRSHIAPDVAERLATRVARRRLLLPFLLRDHRVERIKDIEYAPGAERRHRLDVYRPRTRGRGAPVLLQIHGGAWIVGDKSQQGLPLMLHLAAEGWVCVAPNYRLSPRATFPDHLVDCKRALAWVREHIEDYGGDPDFIVVTGGSAGGHLATLVALTANEAEYQPGFEDVDTSVVACVPFYGVYDLPDLFRAGDAAARASEWIARRVMKVDMRDNPEPYSRASPISHVRADAPPFFVIHGTNDNVVPIGQARRFVAALRAMSHEPVLYAEIPGASHAFDVFHSVRTDHAVNGVDRFLAWLSSAYRTAEPAAPTNPVDTRGSAGLSDADAG